jgi:hypothetical protein
VHGSTAISRIRDVRAFEVASVTRTHPAWPPHLTKRLAGRPLGGGAAPLPGRASIPARKRWLRRAQALLIVKHAPRLARADNGLATL